MSFRKTIFASTLATAVLGITSATWAGAIEAAPSGRAQQVNETPLDPGRETGTRRMSTGNVIFLHPDGTALNHWSIARLFYRGADGSQHWDQLPHIGLYRGHLENSISGTSHGSATTHAFGYKVDAMGSFGRDGDGSLGLDRPIRSLSGFSGSIMREAANAGIPVGIVNDGHIAEPGTGVFLAEAGNRNDWQEITRQIILGRTGMNDIAPWVILGGGEADTLPAGRSTLHRNVNEEREAPLNSRLSLRTDTLDLQSAWNAMGSGDMSNDPARLDDHIVIRTRAEFEALRRALDANPDYAPRVLGLFAFHDTMNDRPEADLIARGLVRSDMQAGEVGPAPEKQSRLVLFGDPLATEPGFNPPSFAEMTGLALTILERAASRAPSASQRRFFLVAEPESADNFGNNGNAIGMLESLRRADEAIGVSLDFLRRNPRTLILTAADSDAGGMQAITVPALGVKPPTNNLPAGREPDVLSVENLARSGTGLAPGSARVPNAAMLEVLLDGVEGFSSPLFVTEPDQFGNRQQFVVAWTLGFGDMHGGMLSRAAGLNAPLLGSTFSQRFDNIDVYRMMHGTLFGRLLPYPSARLAPDR
ncbi:alkaline phosphatase [Silanimonas sp.]|uniref:alkaline phosphatase n=1 Tax=Silanimonas sp. TaxID=1929290 RepID=UPI001BBB3C4F|nr:alkaline phosphatase [Silanimonas sp.]MBS3896602.1 alkaline phosphatase [Silanimonas sp.]MBS3923911.1 alkaline phosphatase [Xanthomonadaceae bacterium]